MLIDLGRSSEAETVLRTAGKLDTDAFLNYRLSQAMLGQGKADEALAAIELALAHLQGDKFRPSFLEQRFLARKAQGDPLAVGDLDAAIAVCQPGRYLDALLRRKAEEAERLAGPQGTIG